MSKKLTIEGKHTLIVSPLTDRHMEVESEDLEVSDGYHTMSELYDHRRELNRLCFELLDAMKGEPMFNIDITVVLKARKHHDGTMFNDYFMVMAIIDGKQISYHYKLKHWDEFDIPAYDICPYPYDGHTSKDVLERLKKI